MAGIELLQPADWFTVTLRLTVAIASGALIGWERQSDHKPAGLRTHMLVSLGAALFLLTGIQTGMTDGKAGTLSHIMQGIITGVGFLGAGEIIERKSTSEDVKIQGLTSAAAIWVSAALGVASGAGLWPMSLFGAIATYLILRVIKQFEKRQ